MLGIVKYIHDDIFMVSLLKKPALIINTVSIVTRTVTVRLPAVTSKEDVLLSVYQEK